MATLVLSSTECACTPLQASFLEHLKGQLKVFKTLPDSKSFVEVAIREYVQKFIQAGSTSVDHLHEHLQKLYKREFLITDQEILNMAKKIADDMQPSRSLLLSASSLSSAHSGKHTSSSSPTLRRAKPLFSKPVVYHACLCCRAVNTCTHEDYSTFFKDEANCYHSFKEVSISRSEEGRYLIAVQDSTYYFAFQSEPNIAQWPERYQSFSEGN